MKTPFDILGVAADAGDEAIKKAYLQRVKEHPPEREPERFQAIRTAYELIATDKQRRMYHLFHWQRPDFSDLLEHAVRPGPVQRPDAAALLAALTENLADVVPGPTVSR